MLPCQPVCPDRNPPGLGHLDPFVDLSEVNGDAGHHGVLLQSFRRHLLITNVRQRHSEEERIHQGQAAVRCRTAVCP